MNERLEIAVVGAHMTGLPLNHELTSRGVDVILDLVGGSYVQRNIEAAAPWGRIVNIAYQESFSAQVNFAPVLTKRLTLAATTLRGPGLVVDLHSEQDGRRRVR